MVERRKVVRKKNRNMFATKRKDEIAN